MAKMLSSVLIALSLSAICAGEPSGPPRDSWTVEQLIAALTDPDAANRKAASDRLVRRGVAARPQLLEAARSDDPEQRAQAAAILKTLPWWTETDPPKVREMLEGYGEDGDGKRAAIVQRLDDISATEVLFRLLGEEPSDAVRWTIVSQLGTHSDARTLELARKLQPEDDPQTLLLAGVAWLPRDRAKAFDFFRRAIDADDQRPSNDGGILIHAFDKLVDDALGRGAYDEAAALLRRQVPREMVPQRQPGSTEGFPASLAVLMMLHEYLGPLEGYARDLQTWNVAPRKSNSAIDAITRLFMTLGHAPPTPQGLTIGLSADNRMSGAIYFLNREINPVAELELRATLAMPKPQPELYDPRIALLLAHLKTHSDDDATVVDLLERGLQIKTGNALKLEQSSENDVQADLHWRRARIAQRAGDADLADAHVTKLMQLTPSSSDSSINIINWLRESTRHEQAKTLFDKIYAQSHARLEAAGEKAGPNNDLAWFCARTGSRLEEALKMSQAAVEVQPQNHAFLDTLAECHYRVGHRDEAIKWESRALELKPESTFFHEQLERFRAAKR